MTALDDYLAADPSRCAYGYDIEAQHPALCGCEQGRGRSEWATFVAALRQAADHQGLISQTRVRPLIQRIPHKHRGQLYRRAVAEGLIRVDGTEPSTDLRGRNTDKVQRRYRLTSRVGA